MATWRCPGCGTQQVDDGTGCFICGRAALSCATCANFRRSVAAGVGYCAIDRRREPLTGDEQRPCWTAAASTVIDGLFALAAPGQPSPRGLVEMRPTGQR